MSEKHMFEILQNLLNPNEIKKLTDTLIITIPGGYELFGEYRIIKEKNTYKVSKYSTFLDETFYSLQNATIFSTLHKRNKVVEAKRIIELDLLLESANASIERYKYRGTMSADKDSRIIADAKYEEAKYRKKIINFEISDYLSESKIWQEGRFREAVK